MQPISELPRPALHTRTFTCMGTVISLTLPLQAGGHRPVEDEHRAATAVVEQLFAGLDEIFSLYRPESEASRLARGEITLRDASAVMRRLYAEAANWRLETEGAFNPERPDGVLDLSGIVKGYAIQEAGTSLLALGLDDWCLNAGGDVLVNGSPLPGTGSSWQAGIVDPGDRRTLIAGHPIGGPSSRRALATSGSAERGDHIWAARSGGALPAVEFTQVSVAAADIVTADVLATAIVAGGLTMLDRAADGWDIDVLAVRSGGELLATPGFRH